MKPGSLSTLELHIKFLLQIAWCNLPWHSRYQCDCQINSWRLYYSILPTCNLSWSMYYLSSDDNKCTRQPSIYFHQLSVYYFNQSGFRLSLARLSPHLQGPGINFSWGQLGTRRRWRVVTCSCTQALSPEQRGQPTLWRRRKGMGRCGGEDIKTWEQRQRMRGKKGRMGMHWGWRN